MSLALAMGGGALTADDVTTRARELDVRALFLRRPTATARAWRPLLKAGGVETIGVGCDLATDGELEQAVRVAAALRAGGVVCEGGAVEADDSNREELVERTARFLHPHLAGGAPVGFRPSDAVDGLIGFEETGWLLEALPRARVWLDPSRALRLQRDEGGPPPQVWAEAYADRCGGVFVHGLGAAGDGGAHPSDQGPDWSSLVESLPTRAPWVLDLDDAIGGEALRDAVEFVRAIVGS